MGAKIKYLLIAFAVVVLSGCGRKVYFDDYLPFTTGSKWIFEDDEGALAEVEVSADSLSTFRDTIYKVFFLGKNLDFLKTPNTLSWHFVKTVVIEDREIFMEDRYYPFFEMPFVAGRTGRIVYEKYDNKTGAYFKRIYEYIYNFENRGIRVNISTDALYVYNNDSTDEQESYSFLLVPDTGFVEITYVKDGRTHNLNLIEYRRQ